MSNLKTFGFIIGCMTWLLTGLTLLGPLAGQQLVDPADGGPSQELLALVCPARLPYGETASIYARFPNRSGKTQTYDTDIQVGQSGETRLPMSVSCEPPDPVDDGQTGSATCRVGPLAQVTRVHLTVWADGESTALDCKTDCKNSYRGSCVILPDIWAMLFEPGALFMNGVILGMGLGLVALGTLAWRSTGGGAHFLMTAFFSASALMLAMAVAQTFGSGIAAALVIGPVPEAILVAGLWHRSRK